MEVKELIAIGPQNSFGAYNKIRDIMPYHVYRVTCASYPLGSYYSIQTAWGVELCSCLPFRHPAVLGHRTNVRRYSLHVYRDR